MSLETVFSRLAAASMARRRWVVVIALVLVAVSSLLAASRLELKTSNLDLIDGELEPVRRFEEFAGEFGTPNQLVVVLEGRDPPALAAAVDRLAPLLRRRPEILSVMDRVPGDPEALEIMGVDPYLTSRDGGMSFLFVQPSDPRSSVVTLEPFLAAVREVLQEAVPPESGVRAGLTGIPQYALDDRDTVREDLSRLSLLSLVAIVLLFAVAFHRPQRWLAVIVALVAGVGVTLGIVTLVPGYLTLLSAFFAAILFGLGADAGIHLLDRIEELLADGASPVDAVPAAVGALARPLVTSALTTASVLFSMRLSGFRGFAELGTVAGIGVLVCLVSMVTVFPALLSTQGGGRPSRALFLLRWSPRHRGLALGLVAAALLGVLLPPAAFDNDYLQLQPKGSEAVRLERAMVQRSEYSPEFAVLMTASEERARELTVQLLDEETVGSVRSYFTIGQGAAEALSPADRSVFVSPEGRYAVYAYPAENIWLPEPQERFVERMQAIDGGVTGMPILGAFMVERSKHALRVTGLAGGLLLLGCVFLDFRRPMPALVALLPTLLTLAALNALMHLFGLRWNPLSVMALPLVLGLAVDDGVHLVHRFLREGRDPGRTLAGAGRGVLLTSLTTLAAFAVLSFARHQGLASFARVLSLGVAAAMVLSLLALPHIMVALLKPGQPDLG